MIHGTFLQIHYNLLMWITCICCIFYKIYNAKKKYALLYLVFPWSTEPWFYSTISHFTYSSSKQILSVLVQQAQRSHFILGVFNSYVLTSKNSLLGVMHLLCWLTLEVGYGTVRHRFGGMGWSKSGLRCNKVIIDVIPEINHSCN